jgi:hypothetical protein
MIRVVEIFMLTRLKYVAMGLVGTLFLLPQANAGFYADPPMDKVQSPFYVDNALRREPLNDFSSLVIVDYIDVSVKTGMKQSQMLITGDPETVRQFHFDEKNSTLIVYGSKNWLNIYKPLHVDISTRFLNNLKLKGFHGRFEATNLNMPYFNANIDSYGTVLLKGKIGLHNLVVSGSGNTQIQGVNSQSLQILMKGKPTVDLSGVANLESLVAEGSGKLRLSWIDSDKLHVRQAGTSYVALAGIAKFVDLELADKSHFSGQYLRVKDGYIKTYDQSVADVQFLKTQAILSNDESRVHFYGKPPYEANFMGAGGSILDMNDH